MRTKKTREDGSYEAYLYDEQLRLTEVRYSSGRVVTFVLDAWGNRFDQYDSMRPTGQQTHRYTVNAFNQVTQVRATSTLFTNYAYDLNGNLLSETQSAGLGGGVTTYGWNRENRLTSVASLAGVTSYQYDANGLRIRRVDSTGTTNYLLDGASVLEELDGAGEVTTRYLNNPELIDDVFSHETTGGIVYPLADALGSVYALSDSSGAIVRRYNFEVYGERVDLGGSGASTDRGATGRWHDANGLIEHRDRLRRPSLGSWAQVDRLGVLVGANLYLYANANPLLFEDSDGMRPSYDFLTVGKYPDAREMLERSWEILENSPCVRAWFARARRGIEGSRDPFSPSERVFVRLYGQNFLFDWVAIFQGAISYWNAFDDSVNFWYLKTIKDPAFPRIITIRSLMHELNNWSLNSGAAFDTYDPVRGSYTAEKLANDAFWGIESCPDLIACR